MKEICRRGPVFALGVPEVRRGVRLVWTLVLREANVPINAHKRTSGGAWIGDEIRANLLETGGQIGDQPQERPANLIFVTQLVRKQPLPLVMEPHVLEKSQET